MDALKANCTKMAKQQSESIHPFLSRLKVVLYLLASPLSGSLLFTCSTKWPA